MAVQDGALTQEASSKSATTKGREAPPEASDVQWTRRFIIVSFWLVALCLGLPYWLWTTSIHRADLPLQLMDDWATGKTCPLRYPLNINLASAQLGQDQQLTLSSLVEQQLTALPDFRFLKFHVNGPERPVLSIQLHEDAQANSPNASLSTGRAVLTVHHRAIDQLAEINFLATLIATNVQKIFKDEEATLSHLLRGTAYDDGNGAYVSVEKQASLDARTTRSFKYAPSYHITFSLFAASAAPSAWDIEEALEKYITPLFQPLSTISRISINTQVQLHASFSPSIEGPVYNNNTKQWELQSTDLSGFINAAEWPLSPSIGSGPTINFVLYIPSERQRPLVIADSGATSWLIPQWGGVQILNPNGKQSEQLDVEDLRPAMLTFADQFTSLIGLPPSPPSISLRISSLERERATSLILSASSTLGALARLTLKLTSIAIPDSVSKSVDEALHRLNLACGAFEKGRFDDALENARIAETEAESAFFEPSMVGQVYFPDEHKVAVYVPLLGPMAVPMIMAGMNELKNFRQRKMKTS